MMNVRRILMLTVIIISAIAGHINSANAQRFVVTECPGLVTEPGTYVLRNDIAAIDSDPCFDVDSSNVTIRLNGFTITAERAVNAPTGGSVIGGFFVDRIQILGPGRLVGTGISLVDIGADRALIRNVVFVDGGASLSVTNSRFERNEMQNAGLLMQDDEVFFPGICQNNKVRQNRIQSRFIPIRGIGCSGTLIEKNIIDATSPFQLPGIALLGNYRVLRNEVFNANSAGILLDGSLFEAESHGTVIEGNKVHDNAIGIEIAGGRAEDDFATTDTLVRKNRLDDNQDQIRFDELGTQNTMFVMNRCDPPDNDPVCTSTFAPNEPAAAAAPAPASMQVFKFEQAPLLIMPLKQGKPLK